MDLQLNSKTALVFGAGGGLGGAIARSLAAEGVSVVVADIHEESARATADKIRAEGGKAMPLTWDIGDLSLIGQKLDAIETAFGPVDILVDNTGGPPPTPAAGQSPDDWSKYFDLMVRSVRVCFGYPAAAARLNSGVRPHWSLYKVKL